MRTDTWWLAARPASLVKIALPVGVGLAIGLAESAALRPLLALAGLAFAWLVQLMVIFMNDYADAEADRLHTVRFPHLIDRRVIPFGLLRRADLLRASGVVIALLLALGCLLALGAERPWAPAFSLSAVFFIWAYSFPPIRLNYRGHGELLETVTVGGGLVWFGFYLYTGRLDLPLFAVVPVLLVALASSLISSIKHQPADRFTGKRTVPVLYGCRPARLTALAAVALSALVCAYLTLAGLLHPSSALLTIALPALFFVRAAREVRTADAEHLASLGHFKGALNRAVYVTNLGLILGFTARMLVVPA